eukprot:999063-Alexandrium_andersonii.AAC.1
MGTDSNVGDLHLEISRWREAGISLSSFARGGAGGSRTTSRKRRQRSAAPSLSRAKQSTLGQFVALLPAL